MRILLDLNTVYRMAAGRGDYGPLLIEITNKYAESAQYFDKETKALFDKTANGAYESAKYFFYPSVDSNGETF